MSSPEELSWVQGACRNCKRSGVDVASFEGNLVRKKKKKKFYCILDQYDEDENFNLCRCCWGYLVQGTNKYKHYWPSMVLRFLEDDNIEGIEQRTFTEKWSLIPSQWRVWWDSHFRGNLARVDEIGCLFDDVTKEKEALEEAIDELKWVDLAKAMDKHVAYPEVRCPFGCSEFLHRVNCEPFEQFLWHFSNYKMETYCRPVGKQWTDCISPSFPKTCLILGKFPCRPSVVLGEDGPMILLCREHSSKSKGSYLHVPESPTGNIYSPNANAFAPVVIRPRTNRNFKRNVCSDTFCTVDQVGGYCGADSCWITSSNQLKCDGLSSLRDAISLLGRPDVKAQLMDRSSDKKSQSYLSEKMIDEILDYAEKLDLGPLSSLQEWESSTYVDCETAIALQEKIYGNGSKTIQVYDDTGASYQDKLFVPPWPTSFVRIHPMDDHGERFQRVMERDFGLWRLLCMTVGVQELWESVAHSVTDNRDWSGHWMRYASSFLRLRGIKRKCEIFKLKKREHMVELFRSCSGGVDLGSMLEDRSKTALMFGKCDDVLVVDRHLPSDEELGVQFRGKKIVICLHPRRPTLQQESKLFELRCLLSSEDPNDRSKYQMHVRHPGKQMWVQRGTSHCMRANSAQPGGQAWNNSYVAVYCRIATPDSEMMKRRYLSVIGGQSDIYCRVHKCPLILNHFSKAGHENVYKCICDDVEEPGGQCGCYSAYICSSHKDCKVAVCQRHSREVKERCKRSSARTVFSLSRSGGHYTELPSDSSFIVPDADAMEVDVAPDVAPEALGPTAAHEIAQDMVEGDYYPFEESDDSIECESSEADSMESFGGDDVGGPGTMNEYVDVFAGSNMEGSDLGEEYAYAGAEDDSVEDDDLPGLTTNRDETGVAATEQEEEEINEDAYDMTGIPCTRVGAEQPSVNISPSVVSSGTVPHYVLLNMQGHLLTRSRSKLRMNKKQRAIFEKLVSRTKSAVIPLVYGEAQLFPSVFWQSLPDGTIPGAIPTALWSDAGTLKRHGIASMREHAKQRISNPASLTSVDPAYHFQQMDVNLNLGLRGKDTRIILNRGFADYQGSDGVNFRGKSDGAELYGETCKNHSNVHKLSALVQERVPHFFFTQSCNQESCGGLRILRQWVTSEEARSQLRNKYHLTDEEADRFLRESAASYILRSWNEVSDLWMKYIIYSEEQPLGEIEYAWYRKEFQEKQGNPSHIHAILRTRFDISTPEGSKNVLSKIRGCVADLVRTSEAIEMKEKGLISSVQQLIELLETAKKYLSHNCHERCQIPQTDANGNTTFVCKVQDNYLRTYTPSMHTFRCVDVRHSPGAKEIYNRPGIKLMQGDIPLHESLKSERHVPICSSKDRKFSATNGHLFVCYPSSQNLQFTTGHTISAYLVKYVSGFDEVAVVVVRPLKKHETESVEGAVESLKNTKITSNKVRADKKKKRLKNTARILTQMECLTVLLGSDLVTSTEKFIHLPTAPREYRAAFFKKSAASSTFERVDDFIDEDVVPHQEIRKEMHFRESRLFSEYQEEVIKDERESSLSVDAITAFSIRPPELRFVNSVRLYLRWFERVPLFRTKPKTRAEYINGIKTRLDRDLLRCEWIDGLDMKVVLRRGAIREILAYVKDDELCGSNLFGRIRGHHGKRAMVRLLEQLEKLYRQFGLNENPAGRRRTAQSSEWQYKLMCEKFLSKENKEDNEKGHKLPIIWTTPVYPTNKGRFLVHLLLRFGRFETEYELMQQGNMKLAFIHAGLFQPEHPVASFEALVKRYAVEGLGYMPGSTFQKDRNLCFAESLLSELLLDESDDAMAMETPCVLQSMIEDSTCDKAKKWRKEHTVTFIESLYESLRGAGFRDFELPNRGHLLELIFPSTESSYQPVVSYCYPPMQNALSPQSPESFDEQHAILLRAKSTIARYRSGSSHRNIVVCGGPGNGKTTVCEEICMYAFSQGLSGMVTSIVADRSKTLGGIHVHSLCSIPMSERSNLSPGRAAESAIVSLYRKPELLYLWQKMDFLCIDEFGAVSAEMLATMDIVARHIKKSNRFMGGMLLICTMDPRQLLPVTGTAVMLSMNMMTEFSFSELKESVRAANDRNLQRICELSRTIEWTGEKKAEFKSLIKNNCNFVSSLNDQEIPDDAIFVFGRKSPCRSVEESILQRIRNSGVRVVQCEANDEESSYAGNWRPASAPASAQLSTKVKEKKELYLFENGRYEFTYNRRGHFQQGQLAILLELDEDEVRQRSNLQFYKGPPGCKEFPPLSEFDHAGLTRRGWKPVSVPFESSQPKRIWSSLLGRRTQYGVRLRVASTIHACQGATFGKLATAVTSVPAHPDLNFALWEAAQVVVLVSRTRRCSDIYFIGDPNEVADQLLAVLCQTGRYLKHIQELTRRLCGQTDETTVLVRPPIFRPCDIVIEKVPAVYLLVSTKHAGFMYIGETGNIRKRLNQHNSGQGSKFTNSERLRPWALYAFVVGFEKRSERHLFEQRWKRRALEQSNRMRRRTPDGVLQIGIEIAFAKNRKRDKDSKLVVRQCGEMESQSDKEYVVVPGT